jgi:CRP-like cAMP-binding protein
MSGDFETLRNIRLFAGVSDAAIAQISRQCSWLHLKPGTHVLQTSDPSSDIFFITKGRVTVNHFSSTGREVTYTKIGEGQFFGEFSAIDGRERSANVVTDLDSVIARFSSAMFRAMLTEFPEVAVRLCEHLVRKNRELTARVYEFSAFPVPHRVKLELLRMCEHADRVDGRLVISPAPTHYEIATRTSTHREAVSRELSALAHTGILEVKRRAIVVKNHNRLKAMVDEFREDL